jgi:hypothetical protein
MSAAEGFGRPVSGCLASVLSVALLVLTCTLARVPAAAAQEEEGATSWVNRCNDALGYTGCANMMSGHKANAPPPKPDVWGAIAVSPSTLRFAASWNYHSEAAASALALGQCQRYGARDCQVTAVADVCVALIESQAEKVYFIGGPVGLSNFAEDAAMARCKRAGGKSCTVMTSFCAEGQARKILTGHTVESNGNPIFVPDGPVRTAPAILPMGADTARFFGTWTTSVPVNGQTVTLISVHNAIGFRNFVAGPAGNVPAGDGTFDAENGHYSSNAPAPNDSGTYRFVDSETVLCTNAAGQTATWKRTAKPQDGNAASQASNQPPAQPTGTTLIRK